MDRLGLWGKGTCFKVRDIIHYKIDVYMPAVFADVLPRGAEKDAPHFVSKLDKRGIGVMELLAMDIKSRGMFLARSLSYERAEFKIDKVPLLKDYDVM